MTLELAAINTQQEIDQYREDQRPASVFCAWCNLRAMMTIEQLNDHVERCTKCRK